MWIKKGRIATRPYIFSIHPGIFYFNLGERYFPV